MKTKNSPESIDRLLKEIQASSLGEEAKVLAAQIITSYLYVLRLLTSLFSRDRSVIYRSRKELKTWIKGLSSFFSSENHNVSETEEKKSLSEEKSGLEEEKNASSDSSKKEEEGETEPAISLPPEKKKTEKKPRKKRKNGEYNPERRCFHSLETLKSGDRCPECSIGKVYFYHAKVIPLLDGLPPLQFEEHHLQQLRCNACGRIFTAQPPENFPKKGRETASALAIGILQHYYMGTPFTMMATFQRMTGQNLSASQIWEKIVLPASKILKPIYDQFVKKAADAPLIYTDDTNLTILSFEKENEENRKKERKKGKKKNPEDRVSTYSSGFVAPLSEGGEVVLYFHGRKYAGENLADLLGIRQEESIQIQMKDGSTMNAPPGFEVVEAFCNSHSLRKFKDSLDPYPKEGNYILKRYSAVFKWDAYCREEQLDAETRLKIHREQSLPLMEEIRNFSKRLLDEHKVEPNSGFGKAINYLFKHYDGLIAFCRYLGAPLENNTSERAIKLLIRRRKNSLFFKTEFGAEVGEIVQSVLYTAARYDQDNVYRYLIAIFENEESVHRSPECWMPWNYQSILSEIKEEADLSFETG